ncbi:hypothetical protein VPH35_022865 [Triticum aestivum]
MRISLPWDVDVYGTMGHRRRSEAEEIPNEMLQEILMKLPTKDVARSYPSFRKLHAASPAALSAEPEFLRLSGVPCGLGQSVKTSVFMLSSDKPMCCIAKPEGYGLADICNGLLCFVLEDRAGEAPTVVCNPATGETLVLPAAPPLSNKDHAFLFAFGFSPPTNEYKLFRLSFPLCSYSSEERVDMDVYTLGDTHGWCRDSFLSPSRPLIRGNDTSTPVLIDGKLHVVTKGWNAPIWQEVAGVLVVDVPAETCRAYPLPDGLGTYRYDNPLAFELKGRLCLAAHVLNSCNRPKALRFWVMAMENKESDGKKEPHWEPWSAWFQHEMLFYTCDDTLYKYGTRLFVPDHGRLLQWHKQLQQIPSYEWIWTIHRGYRPTLLSPHIFELQPSSQDETMMDICS